MSDLNRIAGGMDAMRLSAEEREALARAEKRATARGNLAALLVDVAGGIDAVRADAELARQVAEEFAELCDALDLGAPAERAPGVCRRDGCSNETSFHAAARARGHERKGYCSARCEKLANLRNVEAVS